MGPTINKSGVRLAKLTRQTGFHRIFFAGAFFVILTGGVRSANLVKTTQTEFQESGAVFVNVTPTPSPGNGAVTFPAGVACVSGCFTTPLGTPAAVNFGGHAIRNTDSTFLIIGGGGGTTTTLYDPN